MPEPSSVLPTVKTVLLLGLLLLTHPANAQGAKTLLRIERLRAELSTDTSSMSIGRNAYDAGSKGTGALLDIHQYPNSSVCLVVREGGKYYFEKKEERTVGRPKAKSAEGVLSQDELKFVLRLLDDEGIKKLITPKAPDLPSQATSLKEAERLDVLVDRGVAVQQFTFMKQRVTTGASITGASMGGLSGLDTFVDNGAPYKKTVAPLLKWFDEIGKKSKLTETKPQYCM